MTEPDNPLALVAALRGELFGVSDAALYDFKRLGGPFSFRSPVPGGMDEADAGALADAFARLEEYSLWLAKMPPVVAIERIAADLGLFVSASSAPGGEFQAGSLGKAIELLRAAQANAWTAADLVEHLGKLVRREEPYDGVPARSHEEPVVRVMNLHKVKGLEAPVVFLADPSGASAHPVELHVDRSGSKVLGYLIVSEKEGRRRPEVLAQPPGWGSLAEEEGRFQEAEGLRLLYVAATRAGAQLIIARRRKNRGKNPWQFFEGHLDGRPELADPGGQRALAAEKVCIRDEDVTKARRSIGDRWLAARAPGYAVAAAKEISVTSPGLARASGEHGTEWGTVVHVLLETAAKNAGADIRALAASALADQGLEAALADAAVETVRAVMRSDVWARAAASERRLAEVPFQTLVEPAEGPPTVLRGVIDLVFRERDGWVIVDYKTDDPRGRAVEELVEQYRPQVLTYADAWEGAAGEPVREAGLYFTRPGRYVVCPRG